MTKKLLYFTILQALLGYNIFHSLFSGDIAHNAYCGSWFFPNLDGGGTGFMGTGELECPNQIQGKLTEALWTSIFLLAIWLLSLRSGKNKSEFRSPPYQDKPELKSLLELSRSESKSFSDGNKSESKSFSDGNKSESRWPPDTYVNNDKQTWSRFTSFFNR